MSPNIAAVLCGFFILALFLLNHDRNPRASWTLWMPVAWLSISASRMVSQWLGAVTTAQTSDSLVEGSPFDALIFTGFLAAGLIVLFARRRLAGTFLRKNGPLLIFFLYCLISVLWSDYPFVAFKRWTKALGDLVMILVVLTDPEPTAALKRFLSRAGFLLIPLSILLIRYYPSMGRAYSDWTGEAYNIGVATGKNGLGYVCLVFGLGSLWCFLEALRGGEGVRRARTLTAHGAILALALWLFQMAHSATSFSCFLIGGGLIAVTRLRVLAKNPAVVHLLVGSLLFVILYGVLLNPGAGLVQTVGRDPTLTGRTALWGQALNLTVNPVFGAGYESFWLGARLDKIWAINWEHPTQAHNGYLEVYFDLGWVGVTLIAVVMVWGYRNIIRALRWNPDVGRLKLAFFVIAAVYNLTEHAFRELHPVWILLLLAVTIVPEPTGLEAA